MAELLGLVSGTAGLASLAIELLECAKKLERFHDDMHDAVAKLDNLIFDIETIKFTLQVLHRRRQQAAQSEQDEHIAMIMDRCIAVVERSLSSLQKTVAKVERHMQWSKR